MHANGCNANFKAWIATLHPENVQLDHRMWLDQGEQITLWRELSGKDAPPPSPPKARAPDAPPPSTPKARAPDAPSSSLPKASAPEAPPPSPRARRPVDEPPPPSPPGFKLEAKPATSTELDSLPVASATLATPNPGEIDLWKNLRRGRSSETPETPSSVGGNHSRSEATRGNQTPSSAGVATTPVMSTVTTPDNSTANVAAKLERARAAIARGGQPREETSAAAGDKYGAAGQYI